MVLKVLLKSCLKYLATVCQELQHEHTFAHETLPDESVQHGAAVVAERELLEAVDDEAVWNVDAEPLRRLVLHVYLSNTCYH